MSDDINKLASDLATRYRTGRLVKAAAGGAVHGPALPPGTGGYTPAMNRPFPAAPSVDWLTALQNDAGSAWGKLPPALQYALIGGGGLGALGLLSDPGEDAAGRKRSRLTRALRGLLLGGGLGGGLGLMMQAAPGATAGPGTTSPELAKAEAAAAAAEAKRQAILNPPGEQRPTITPKLLGLEATKARATRDAVLPPTAAAPIGPEQISNSQAYAKRYGFPENSIPERLQSSAQLSPEQLDAKMKSWLPQNEAATAEQLRNRDTEQMLAGLIGPEGGSVTDGSLYQGATRGAGLGAALGAGRAMGQNAASWHALRNPQTIKLKELLDGLSVPTGESRTEPGRIPGTTVKVEPPRALGLEGLRQAIAGSAKSEALRTPPPGDPGQAAVMDKRIVTPARPFAAEKYQYLQRVPAQVGKPYQTSTGRIVTPPSLPARYSKHLVQPAQPATPAVTEDYVKQPARQAKPAILPRVSEERVFEQLANTPKRPAVGAGATDHLLAQHGSAYAGGGSGLTPDEVKRLAQFQPKFQHQPVIRNTLRGAAGGALLGTGLGAAMPLVDKKIDTAVNAVKAAPGQLRSWLQLRGTPPAQPATPPGMADSLRARNGELRPYSAATGNAPPAKPPGMADSLLSRSGAPRPQLAAPLPLPAYKPTLNRPFPAAPSALPGATAPPGYGGYTPAQRQPLPANPAGQGALLPLGRGYGGYTPELNRPFPTLPLQQSAPKSAPTQANGPAAAAAMPDWFLRGISKAPGQRDESPTNAISVD